MAVSKEVASQVFNQNTSLDQNIETSTAWWGGEDFDKKAQNMNADQSEMAKELYYSHYYYLKNKFKSDPESMEPYELVAAQLYQRIESGEELNPNDQARLYTALGKLSEEMSTNPNLANEMGLPDTTDAQEYLDELGKLQREMFFNLTGFDRDPTDAESRMLEDEYVNRRYSPTDLSFRAEIGRLWTRIRLAGVGGVDNRAWDEIQEEHEKNLFSSLSGDFRPEVELNAIQMIGIRTSADKLAENYVRHFGSAMSRPQAEIDAYLTKLKDARTPQDVEYVALDMQTSWGVDYAFGPGKLLEAFDPNKKAAEALTENLFAEDMDKIARAALQRELPSSVEEMADALSELKTEIASLEAEEKKAIKGGKNFPAAKKTRLNKLREKRSLVQQAISASQGKGVEQILKQDQTIDSLETNIPSAYRNNLLKHMVSEYGIDTSAGHYDTEAKQRARVNRIMKQKPKFSIASLFLSFLGTEALKPV